MELGEAILVCDLLDRKLEGVLRASVFCISGTYVRLGVGLYVTQGRGLTFVTLMAVGFRIINVN